MEFGLRGMWKRARRQRLYTALNIAGLSLGIATFLTLGLVARYELGWDRWLPGAGHIYELQATVHMGDTDTVFADMPRVLLPALRAQDPDLLGTQFHVQSAVATILGNGNEAGGHRVSITFTDRHFFDVFKLRFAAGDPKSALTQPAQIVISASAARDMFGTTAALGRSLHLTYGGHTSVYIVSGVLASYPRNLSVDASFVALAPEVPADRASANEWATFGSSLYLTASTRAQAHAVVARGYHLFADSPFGREENGYFAKSFHFFELPLVDAHFGSSGTASDGASRDVVMALALVGMLALLAAAINYVNLATAQSLTRAREIAVRKTLGAARGHLIRQFLGESAVLAGIAAIPGLALAEGAVPIVASLTGWHVTLDYRWALPILGVCVLAVGLAAGLYPAFVLANFATAPTLASARMPAQGRLGALMRMALVGVQFAFAVGLGICTLIVYAQGQHLRHRDHGMQVADLITLSTQTHQEVSDRQVALMNAIRALPGVQSVALSSSMAGGAYSMDAIEPVGRPHAKFMTYITQFAPGYFQTAGIPLLAGRVPDSAHGEDRILKTGKNVNRPKNMLISLDGAHRLGFANPADAIGQQFESPDGDKTRTTIIGVVGDVYFGTGQNPDHPTVYALDTEKLETGFLLLRVRPQDMLHVMTELRRIWADQVPGIPFEAEPLRQLFDENTRADVARGTLFAIGGGVAIVIACLGLYGLAAFNAARRMHEIGIRKTLGATSGQVLRLLLAQFLRPVLVASLVSWPVAYGLMQHWLSGFDQRIALSPLYFLGVTAGAAALCAATVAGRSIMLARVEPMRALRVE